MVRRQKTLPVELWSQVFQRLPVKSLLKIRSVCQGWRNLIDEPYFIYQHIEYSRNHRESTHFLVAELPIMKKARGWQWMIRQADTFRKAAEPTHLDFTPGYCSIKGYVDGVLLILEEIQRTTRRIFLSNPSIRKCIQIPSNLVINIVHHLQLGLGFDHLCNDYKVVAINWFWASRGHTPISFVTVYSLQSRSWKQIEDDTPTMSCKGPQVFVKGAIHWIGCNKWEPKTRGSQVVSFDVVREAFNYISLPDSGDDLNWRETSLVVFRESLALLDAFRDYLNIWVRDGEAESWIKQYNLNLQLFDRSIYLKNNGELLYVRMGQGLKSYDIESHLVKDLARTYRRRIIFIEPYVESLAFMGGVNGHQVMSLPLQEVEEHNNQEAVAEDGGAPPAEEQLQ